MKDLFQFLKESNGQYSSARLFTLLMALTFIGDWIVHIVRGIEFDPSITVVVSTLGVLGFKVGQKIFGEDNG